MNRDHEWDIYRVLVDYVDAIDCRDMDRVGRCFAPEATANYAGNDVGPGRSAIVDYLTSHSTSRASTHLLGNVRVLDAENGCATAHSIVTATHVIDDDRSTRLSIRGLRYVDELARIDGSWQITHRVHQPIWATLVEGEFLDPAAPTIRQRGEQ